MTISSRVNEFKRHIGRRKYNEINKLALQVFDVTTPTQRRVMLRAFRPLRSYTKAKAMLTMLLKMNKGRKLPKY